MKSLKKIYIEEDVETAYDYLLKVHEQKSKKTKVSFMSLFTKNYRYRLFVCCLFQFFQQFSGINFFVMYSGKIFTQIGQNGNIATLVLNTANFFAGFIAIFTIEGGRKTNFVIGILVQGIAFWAFSMMNYYSWFTLIYPACVMYMVSFSIGMAAASFPWVPETLPPVGCGVSWFFQWTFCALIGKYVPTLSDS